MIGGCSSDTPASLSLSVFPPSPLIQGLVRPRLIPPLPPLPAMTHLCIKYSNALCLFALIRQYAERERERKKQERNVMTCGCEPDLNLQHCKYTAYASDGRTRRTPCRISHGLSVINLTLSLPRESTLSLLNIASQPDDQGGRTLTCTLNFDKGRVQNVRTVLLD